MEGLLCKSLVCLLRDVGASQVRTRRALLTCVGGSVELGVLLGGGDHDGGDAGRQVLLVVVCSGPGSGLASLQHITRESLPVVIRTPRSAQPHTGPWGLLLLGNTTRNRRLSATKRKDRADSTDTRQPSDWSPVASPRD